MNQITFSELSIEARTEAIKESLESTLWSLERSEQQIETLRRLLEEQKKAVGHGNWLRWVRENLGDSDATIQKIQHFMRHSKKSLVTYLPDLTADGQQEGSKEQAIVPREERKPAEVQVRKVEADGNKVPAEPKTNTAYSKENRKASEAERTPPPVVTPEIVVEPEKAEESAQVRLNFAIREVSQVLGKIAEESERRAAAKQLRKLADELDPPTPNEKTPSAAALKDAVPEDLPSDLFEAAQLWAEYKQARPKADRIQSLKAWEIALKKMRSQPASVVVRKIENAIANSWKGWDHDTEHGRPLRGDEW